MIALAPGALDAALTCLTELQRDGVGPTEALDRARDVQARYPDLHVDLVWEAETYDESVHYDLLLRQTGEGTISIAFAPDRALPWPMRGAQRWSDAHLMRVNGRTVKVSQAIAALDFMWEQAPVTERLINGVIVREELERAPVALTRDDIQRAMDAFRRRHRLFTAEATLRWMRERGLRQEQLERMVTEEAEIATLRDRVVGDQVATYFEAHRAAFDTARIARCVFPDAPRASEALARVRKGATSLAALAQERFLSDPDADRDLFAVLTRETPAGALAEAVFAAAPGDLIGPLPVENATFAIAQVLAVEPARLDQPTQRKITRSIFEEWLADRRREATIEWNWGKTDSAGKAG